MVWRQPPGQVSTVPSPCPGAAPGGCRGATAAQPPPRDPPGPVGREATRPRATTRPQVEPKKVRSGTAMSSCRRGLSCGRGAGGIAEPVAGSGRAPGASREDGASPPSPAAPGPSPPAPTCLSWRPAARRSRGRTLRTSLRWEEQKPSPTRGLRVLLTPFPRGKRRLGQQCPRRSGMPRGTPRNGRWDLPGAARCGVGAVSPRFVPHRVPEP